MQAFVAEGVDNELIFDFLIVCPCYLYVGVDEERITDFFIVCPCYLCVKRYLYSTDSR